jgi:ABC-2 type transport system ATP-binding protein
VTIGALGKTLRNEKIGVVLEGARNVYGFMTVIDNLRYFSYLNKMDAEITEARIAKLLEMFSLTEKKDQTVSTLSRGMQQKVAIMIALLKDPEILILDEPTLGLDLVSQYKMETLLMELAQREHKILLISSHDLSLIERVCKTVAIFDKGTLLEFKPLTAFSKSTSLYRVAMEKTEETAAFISENFADDVVSEEDGVVEIR